MPLDFFPPTALKRSKHEESSYLANILRSHTSSIYSHILCPPI